MMGVGGMDLQRRFEVVLRQFGDDAALVSAATRELAAAYADPGRHYHGLAHIATLLDLADTYHGHLRDPASVILAILFHDAVYDPTRSDNEVRSAALARARLTELGVPPALVERVAVLVDLTRHGAAEPSHDDTDAFHFLDWDLSVLGAAPSIYDAYAAAIRREYAHVPDDAYRRGRGQVLNGFLAQPAIYRVPEFKQRWEPQARINIQRESAALSD